MMTEMLRGNIDWLRKDDWKEGGGRRWDSKRILVGGGGKKYLKMFRCETK
jgi:hypothetical protein